VGSDTRYWQVTGALPEEERPNRLNFLHGRFSWEKKTFVVVVIIAARGWAERRYEL